MWCQILGFLLCDMTLTLPWLIMPERGLKVIVILLVVSGEGAPYRGSLTFYSTNKTVMLFVYKLP
jgi:hypothetical protein